MHRLPILALVLAACRSIDVAPPAADRKDASAIDPADPSPLAPPASLPFEPRSAAALLSSTHLLTVEVLSVRATAWSVASDGLERRRLTMEMRLVAALKGASSLAPGQTFPLAIEQRREGESMVSDYHGLWSHAAPEPAPGVLYLAVATTQATAPAEPADLLQEPVCKQLAPAELATDVALAEAGERRFRGALAAGGAHPERDAAAALLRFADAHAGEPGPLGAGYLWARMSPAVTSLRADLLALLIKPETSPALRMELLIGVEQTLRDLADSDPEFLLAATRAMTTLLGEPRAASSHSRLIQVSLFHAVFPDETTARFTAQAIVPDAGTRSRLAEVLKAADSPRARLLLQWLQA